MLSFYFLRNIMSASSSVTPSASSVKKTSLFRSTLLVSFMTMLSRVLGFGRDVCIAQLFGAAAGIDAFFVAFKIPNFMRRLFAEGAFSQAFVPILADYQQNESEAEMKRFLARIVGNLFLVLLGVTFLAVLASPYVIMVFAPGFKSDGARFILATDMLKITFPYLLLISMTALSGAILNTFGRFGVPAFTPVFLNIILIVAAYFFAPYFYTPELALAYGVFFAGIVQLAFQLPFLFHAGLLVKPKIDWQHKGVRKVLTLMLPALFGVSVVQLNLLLDTVFASFLPVGSVSWLYYSDRLTFFPLGVFGVAISTVILPRLSREHASKSSEQYSAALDWGMRVILLIALPSTLGLILFSKPLLMSLLGYGKFSAHDLLMTQQSLTTFSLGITGFMLIKILGSAFYATKNIKTPVKVGVLAVILNTFLCLLFIKPLAHAGLALASSLAGVFNASCLLVLLLKRKIYQPSAGWVAFLGQLLISNAVLGGLLYLMTSTLDLSTLSAFLRLSSLILMVLLAVIVYFMALFVVGIRVSHFRGKVRN